MLEGLIVAAVDNELHILTTIDILLKEWDRIVAIGTGRAKIGSSLRQLERAPDVIIADYHIGVDDGPVVIAAIRAMYGSCPAILMTADRSSVRDMAGTGDVRVLYKPLKPAALLSQWHLVKAAAE